MMSKRRGSDCAHDRNRQGIYMKHLIHGMTAIVIASGVTVAASASLLADKRSSRPGHVETRPAKVAKVQDPNKDAIKNQKEAVKADIKGDKRDLKQDQAQLKRLRKDLKDAQRVGDR